MAMRFRETREEVVRTCIALADRGYLAGTGGNVALRADASHFAVTPSATDYYTMGPEDICLVRLTDRKQVGGEREASVEAGLHAGVLLARPECRASIHTHQPIASAYTLLSRALEVQDSAHQLLLGPRVPCVGYAPSGTALLASRVARAMSSDIHAYLMRNHGVVCVGTSTSEAMRRVAALETECAAFFEACAEREPNRLEPEVRSLVLSTLRAAMTPEIEEVAE
jgi:L-fuculose-phosphate aldolase